MEEQQKNTDTTNDTTNATEHEVAMKMPEEPIAPMQSGDTTGGAPGTGGSSFMTILITLVVVLLVAGAGLFWWVYVSAPDFLGSGAADVPADADGGGAVVPVETEDATPPAPAESEPIDETATLEELEAAVSGESFEELDAELESIDAELDAALSTE